MEILAQAFVDLLVVGVPSLTWPSNSPVRKCGIHRFKLVSAWQWRTTQLCAVRDDNVVNTNRAVEQFLAGGVGALVRFIACASQPLRPMFQGVAHLANRVAQACDDGGAKLTLTLDGLRPNAKRQKLDLITSRSFKLFESDFVVESASRAQYAYCPCN